MPTAFAPHCLVSPGEQAQVAPAEQFAAPPGPGPGDPASAFELEGGTEASGVCDMDEPDVPARPELELALGDPAFAPEDPAFAAEDPAFALEDPAFALDDPAFALDDPAFALEDPTFAAEGPAFALGDPACADPALAALVVEPLPPTSPSPAEASPVLVLEMPDEFWQ